MRTTYSIHVSQKSIGIGFIEVSNINKETVDVEEQVVVSELLRNSKGYKLGVSVGDTLIAINGKSVNKMDTYYGSKLPFNATFQKPAHNIVNNTNETSHTSSHSLDNYCLHNMESKTDGNTKQVAHSMDLEKYKKYQISNYLEMDNNYNIKFKMYNHHNTVYLISSKGFKNGCHYWSFKVLKCDIYKQEIGVVSNTQINTSNMSKNSVTDSVEWGARALYANDIANNKIYYASYNNNGKQRCYKNLKNNKENNAWNEGDIIKIYLDLDRWKIKFYLNDKKVRKAISVEPYKKYYPVVSFIGTCKYQCTIKWA